MTKTRLLAALIMAPIAILTVLFVSTPILAALSAVLFLAALWEWLKLAEVDDTLARSVLLVCNAAVMAALTCGTAVAAGAGACRFVDRSARAMFLRERAVGLPPARLLPSPRHR